MVSFVNTLDLDKQMNIQVCLSVYVTMIQCKLMNKIICNAVAGSQVAKIRPLKQFFEESFYIKIIDHNWMKNKLLINILI